MYLVKGREIPQIGGSMRAQMLSVGPWPVGICHLDSLEDPHPGLALSTAPPPTVPSPPILRGRDSPS